MRLLFIALILFSYSSYAGIIPENPALMEDSYINASEPLTEEEFEELSKNAKTSNDFFRIGDALYKAGNVGVAEKYFKRAIKLESNNALIGLGRLLRDSGRETESLPYFSKAAKANMPEGIYEMGVVYEKGLGVIEDANIALNNYKKAADAGLYNALVKLALYSESLQDISLAVQYYEAAYSKVVGKKQKDLLAAILANHFYKLATTEKNNIRRFDYFVKSGSYGNVNAQYEVAVSYETSRGTAQNLDRAMTMYKTLAQKDFTPAMIRLGILHYDGLNFARDYDESYDWFKKAAEAGDPKGAEFLSDMYLNGRGVEKDKATADEWSKRAKALSGKDL